jgi:hypothetical protein
MAKIRGSTGAKPKGGSPKGSQWEYNQAKRAGLQMMDEDIKALMHSLVGITNPTSFYTLATKYISRRLVAIMAEVLRDAATMAPYDKGLLRESGEVVLVAGKASGLDTFVKIARGSGATESPEVVVLKEFISKPAMTMQMDIAFDREEKGMDIALWAHEELLGYVKRPKSGGQIGKWYATKEGTGPKYLEKAFKTRKADIPREIQKGLIEAVKEYNKRHKTRARRRGI